MTVEEPGQVGVCPPLRQVPCRSNECAGSAQRVDQIAQAVQLIKSCRTVVLMGERDTGRTTALRAVLRTLAAPTLTASASRSARPIPLGALAGLVGLDPTMSSTARVVAAIEALRSVQTVVAVDDADLLDDESATVLMVLAAHQPLLLAVNQNGLLPDAIERIARDHATVIRLAPLSIDELRVVAEEHLSGLLDQDSLVRLSDDAAGSPGRILRRIAGALSDGSLCEVHGVWSYASSRERRSLSVPTRGHIRLVGDRDGDHRPDAVLEAHAALRAGEPEVAARLLAPLVSGRFPGATNTDDEIVTAQLRWALAWAGRPTFELRPPEGFETDSLTRLADARATAELGENTAALTIALAVANAPASSPSVRIDALHLAGRLKIDGSLVRRVAAILDTERAQGDGAQPMMETQLLHLHGLHHRNAQRLEDVADRFLCLHHAALAHEALMQAAVTHQLTGTPRRAGRCRAEAEALATGGVCPTFAARIAAGQLPLLTTSERAVVRLIANGLTLREAAKELGCATRTAESHLQHAYVKLGVNDRTALRAVVAAKA